MNWITIESEDKLNEAYALSENEKVLIFKYSPTCVINYLIKSMLEREWWDDAMRMKAYLLNIKQHNDISRKIENDLKVAHQTPQAIVVYKRKAVYSASHGQVKLSNLKVYAN